MNKNITTFIIIILGLIFIMLSLMIHTHNVALMQEEEECDGHYLEYAYFDPDTGDITYNVSDICVEVLD